MAKVKEPRPLRRPWHPTPDDEFICTAVRALFNGNADETQQKRLVEWILLDLCELRKASYWPDSPRDGDFAEGKKFVGRELVRIRDVLPESLREAPAAKRMPGPG